MTDRPSSDGPTRPLGIALVGAGRMGRDVATAARERGHRIVLSVGGAGIDPPAAAHVDRLTGPDLLAQSGADVAIDVSVADAVAENCRHCASAGVDLVVGTTGWEADRAQVERTVIEASMGFLHAPNFSIGVNLFFRIVAEACRIVEGAGGNADFDACLFEAHHRHKVDHPSGTARHLAEIVVERLAEKDGWSDRLPDASPVEPSVLQVAVTRAGEIPGTHGLVFEGLHDRIELRHEARSRRGFAAGAVVAAEWIHGRTGVFSMDDLLDSPNHD